MTERFDPASIPRGSGQQIVPRDSLCIISANLAAYPQDGVRPGLISVQWGTRLPSPGRQYPAMRPTLQSNVVYDGPPYDPLVDFPRRDPPYYAPFSRQHERSESYPLRQGGRLVASRFLYPGKHADLLDVVERREPPYEETGYHTFNTIARTGSGFEQVDVSEARLVLSALTQAITPDDPAAAQWALQQLLPKRSDADV